MYIEIVNDGELEVAGLSLMGASHKDSISPIGFFGSGNKYAIATMLRKGIEFHIFSGTHEVAIETRDVNFRGDSYRQILVDGEPTSMTTRMGPDWEPWFALREIVANAKDEGGFEMNKVESLDPESGKTKVYIRVGDIPDVLEKLERYLIDAGDVELEVLDTVDTPYGTVDILKKPSKDCTFNCYRKGISVYPEDSQQSLYWYNFEDIPINESRVFKHAFSINERIEAAIQQTENEEIIRSVINSFREDDIFEGDQNYSEGVAYSNTWFDILKGKNVIPEGAVGFIPHEDALNGVIVPNILARKLSKQFTDLNVIGYGEQAYKVVEPTPELESIVAEAMYELMKIGMVVKPEIEYVRVLEGDTEAWYNRSNAKIFICVDRFDVSDPATLGHMMNVLFEEQMHYNGYSDGSREFEQELIKMCIGAKKKLNECRKTLKEVTDG